LYQGALTALRLLFLKEDTVWNIDVLAQPPGVLRATLLAPRSVHAKAA